MRKIAKTLCLMMIGLALRLEAQTVDEIVAKHIAAEGGAARLKALQTMKISGYAEVGGVRAEFSETKKRPGKLRREAHFPGNAVAIEAYDGRKAWKIDPGTTTPQAEQGAELKSLLEDAEFDGPFLDYKEKGHKIELLGTEKINGAETFHLRLTRKSGTVSDHFLSTTNYLELREASKDSSGHDTITDSSDFRDVKGLKIPFAVEHHTLVPDDQVLKGTITAVELDVSLDDSIFQMPTTKP